MKTRSHLLAGLPLLGSLALLAGCTSTLLRQVSESFAPSLVALDPTLTSVPVPKHTVTPQYPSDLRRGGVPGSVNLSCEVDATGQVRAVEVINYTHRDFVDPAVAALRQWTFQPATRDGAPVAVRVRIPISFQLAD